MRQPQFERFPLDGRLYCLVWGARYLPPLPDQATARVRLWLARIDESDPGQLKWARNKDGRFIVVMLEESSGSIPTLIQGSLWRDRTLQPGITQMPGELRVENALLRPQSWTVVRANRIWNSKGNRLIDDEEFPLGGIDARGSLLKFNDAPLIHCRTESGMELLIPCYEIFRRFYCLTTELANAMLGGPWARNAKELINEETTKLNKDGVFEVDPLVNLRDIGCIGVAYFLAMPHAKLHASQVNLTIENNRREGFQEPWIYALPPWQQQSMNISFIGRQLNCGAVLVNWIYQSPFPNFPFEVMRVDQRRVISRPDDSAPRRPPAPSVDEKNGANSQTKVRQPSDAKPIRATLHFNLSDVWTNLGRIQRRVRKNQYLPVNPNSDGSAPPVPRPPLVSTGKRSKKGRTPPGSASSDGQNLVMDRFRALSLTFQQILQEKLVKSIEDYAPVNPTTVGERVYCALPTKIGGVIRPWAILGVTEPRPRLCWVSRITMLDETWRYWLEVETAPRDHFKALVVRTKAAGAELSAETLTELLKLAVFNRATWKNASLHLMREQVDWVTARHAFESKQLRPSLVLSKLQALQ